MTYNEQDFHGPQRRLKVVQTAPLVLFLETRRQLFIQQLMKLQKKSQ